MYFGKAARQGLALLLIAAVFSGCASQGAASVAPPSPVPATATHVSEAAAVTVSAATEVTPAAESGPAPLNVVAIGDSIGANLSQDCPGCKGFVDRYAQAASAATGRPLGKVRNATQHTGMNVSGLVDWVKSQTSYQEWLSQADVIIVGIAHNATPWNVDNDPCDGPNGDNIDWSKYTPACATAAAELYRPKYEQLFKMVAALRAGKPTILRTIDAYNDWIGQPGSDLPPQGAEATRYVLDAWNAMICKAAETNGFGCADIYHAFNGPDGKKPSGDLLGGDYTHPSDKGNEVIARVLSDLGYAPLANK